MSFEYKNKVMLGPMVKVGVLPFRELCAASGADIVFSEELIDKKLLTTKPRFNESLNCTEYASPTKVVYRYRKDPKVPTVLQIGTASAEYALKCANHMFNGYDGIDVNMGCPKPFSVKGGMGVALLRDPERIRDIMTTLRRNITKPVSCKIRIQRDVKKTVDLLKMLDQIGLANITIHSRFPNLRPSEDALPHLIKPLVSGLSTNMTYNGDVYSHKDLETLKKSTGCDSMMIARGALYNYSIFAESESRMLDKDLAASRVIKNFLRYNIPCPGARYTLQRMYERQKKTKVFREIVAARTYITLSKCFSHIKDNDHRPLKKQKVDHISIT